MKTSFFLCIGFPVFLVACDKNSEISRSDARANREAKPGGPVASAGSPDVKFRSREDLLSLPEGIRLAALVELEPAARSAGLPSFFEEIIKRDVMLAMSLLVANLDRIAPDAAFAAIIKGICQASGRKMLLEFHEKVSGGLEEGSPHQATVFQLFLARLSELDPKAAKSALQEGTIALNINAFDLRDLMHNLGALTPEDYRAILASRSMGTRKEMALMVVGEILAETGESPEAVLELMELNSAEVSQLLTSWMDRQSLKITDSNVLNRILDAMSSMPAEMRAKYVNEALAGYLGRFSLSDAKKVIEREALGVEETSALVSAFSRSLTPKELVDLTKEVPESERRDAAIQMAFRVWVNLDSMAAAAAARELPERERDLAFFEIASKMSLLGDSDAGRKYIDAIQDDELRAKAEERHRRLRR